MGREGGRRAEELTSVPEASGPESPAAAMVARQLFGEQLAGMSGGKIRSLEELVAAAQAGKEAAEALPELREKVERQAEAHGELLDSQKKQEAEIVALRREREEMKATMETNQRALQAQIRAAQEENKAAQEASQPMLRAIMAKLGLTPPPAGGGDRANAMQVDAEAGSEASAAGSSAVVLAGPGHRQGSGGEMVVSVQKGAMEPAATAGGRGRQDWGEAASGGLDQLLLVQRRAEAVVERCIARMEELSTKEQEAKAAEAAAVKVEEGARVALESWVPSNGEGTELEEAFFSAKEALAMASGLLAASTAQRKSAEEALARAREELKQAGDDSDSRRLADKRKCMEESEEGEVRGRLGRA